MSKRRRVDTANDGSNSSLDKDVKYNCQLIKAQNNEIKYKDWRICDLDKSMKEKDNVIEDQVNLILRESKADRDIIEKFQKCRAEPPDDFLLAMTCQRDSLQEKYIALLKTDLELKDSNTKSQADRIQEIEEELKKLREAMAGMGQMAHGSLESRGGRDQA